MDDHKKFLADRLLSEEQPVTYRLLSRALDVHVNVAKQLLFDFHQYQNGIKADSVHATYLLHGTKSRPHPQQDGDVEMASSMPEQGQEEEPLSEDVPTTTLTIVSQENLESVLSEYESVTSIHVYSLAPHAQQDLAMLSDVSKSLAEYGTNEDAAALSKKYGTIYNPNMRKRSRNGPPPVLSQSKAPAAKAKPIVAKPVAQPAAAAATEAKVKQETATSGPSSSFKEAAPPSTAPIKAPKKASAGGIMSSFAKTKPPKPKPEPKKEEEDTPMSDDGEADDADVPAPKKTSEKEATSLREAKKEREDALKRMMEEDDEEDEEEDKDEEEKEEEEPDEEMAEAPEPEPESEPKKEDQEPAEVISSTESGRRRGKRRVMKKKRIMDDKGYMVTIQEAGWESFSEDEAPPAKKPALSSSTPTPSSSTTTTTATNTKAKKPAGKAAQGNIMSFFSKK
ncbi:hypothetical protein N3K66_003268 [Trichothecium roseum]|uniref:Uncharacterized protein n=1 Tax=Trichothecium roseum TaxID=47278 RepID=A0ACC0V4X9_9HYPO|nr:hypothetical protein N3K66_003268 [Trichothecium roseum]